VQSNKSRIVSFEDARKKINFILAEINADMSLAIAAASNPILALEALGYEVRPEAKLQIHDTVRFGGERAARLNSLREEIFRIAGHSFDLESEKELRAVLEDTLKLTSEAQKQLTAAQMYRLPSKFTLPPQLGWAKKQADPLEPLRHQHRIMQPLLEYRALEASEPRLASRELFDQIRRGERRTPVFALRGVLKSRPA